MLIPKIFALLPRNCDMTKNHGTKHDFIVEYIIKIFYNH